MYLNQQRKMKILNGLIPDLNIHLVLQEKVLFMINVIFIPAALVLVHVVSCPWGNHY